MYQFLHTNQQENTQRSNFFKKSFTVVELIVSLAVGTTLIIGTYNVLSQSIGTVNETIVSGTIDNYANNIQAKIKKQLISAKYVNVAAVKNPSNKIDSTITSLQQGYNYTNLYFANDKGLSHGIVFDDKNGEISLVYYPKGVNHKSTSDDDVRKIQSIFSEEGANDVTIDNFSWSIDTYRATAEDYNSPDYIRNPSKMVKYKFTLTKRYSSGKKPLVKTYYYTEVLECSI